MNRKHFIQQCMAGVYPRLMSREMKYEEALQGAIRLWDRMTADGMGDAQSRPIAPNTSAYDALPDRDQFDAFWNAYGVKKDREGAARAWLAITNRDNIAPKIIEAAKMAAQEAANNPDTARKYPQGWLSSRRWEDFDVDGRRQQETDNAAQMAVQDAYAELKQLQELPPSDELNAQIASLRDKMRQLQK